MKDNLIWILGGVGALLVLAFKPSKSYNGVSNNVYNWLSEASRASRLSTVPRNVILAVISQESQGNPNAVGSIGEIGLMQLTLPAVKDVGYQRVPKDPAENILAGARYLSLLISENRNLFDALRAYNAGRTRIRQGGSGGEHYANSVLHKLEIIDGKLGTG